MSDMTREELDRAVAILQAARDIAIAEENHLLAAHYRAEIARIAESRRRAFPLRLTVIDGGRDDA